MERIRLEIKVLSSIFVAIFMSLAFAQDFNYANMLYSENCTTCHGADHGHYIGPALNKDSLAKLPEVAVAAIIKGGVGGSLMPPWGQRFSDDQINQLAAMLKATPKSDVVWDMRDIKNSIEVYIAKSSLPDSPQYKISDLDSLMAVMSRGTFSNGENSKVVFFNGENNKVVGEVVTWTAPHLVDYHPTNERWAYAKTDGGRIFKIDLYSMKATRSVKVGYSGPSLAVSWDGRYLATGSFVPNTVVILDSDTLMPIKYLELSGIDPDGKMVVSDSGSITATPYGNYFAIALENAGQVWIADLNREDIPITKIKNVGRHLHDAFLTKDGRYLTIAAYDDSKLAVIDFKTKTVVKDIPAGCVPHTGSGAITKVGDRMLGFGTNFGSGSGCDKTVVTVFDTANFEVVKQIPVIGGTESPAAHPDAPYVAVDIISGSNADKIQLIDKNSLEVVKTLAPGGHSHFPEYTADGKYLYVSAGYAGNKLVIYDSKTLKVVKEVSLEVPAGIFSHVRPDIVTVGLGK